MVKVTTILFLHYFSLKYKKPYILISTFLPDDMNCTQGIDQLYLSCKNSRFISFYFNVFVLTITFYCWLQEVHQLNRKRLERRRPFCSANVGHICQVYVSTTSDEHGPRCISHARSKQNNDEANWNNCASSGNRWA